MCRVLEKADASAGRIKEEAEAKAKENAQFAMNEAKKAGERSGKGRTSESR